MPSLMRTTVADGIYRTLRDMILGLKFEPGQELNVVDLTERLQVSRSPVRDALMKLSNDKLVDIFPQKGTRVSFARSRSGGGGTVHQDRTGRAGGETVRRPLDCVRHRRDGSGDRATEDHGSESVL